MAQKITPNLWFDDNAKDAADFYIEAFKNGSIVSVLNYPKSKEEGLADFQLDKAGKVLTVEFEIGGFRFVNINGGSDFKPNSSISCMVNFDTSTNDQAREQIDDLWEKLADGGVVMMPIGEYPYSKRYGWVQDKYGVSWQLSLSESAGGEARPFIMPSLLFGWENANKAEDAMNFYTSVFEDSKVGMVARYEQETGPAKAGSLMYADFVIGGQWFAAMDSGVEQDFTFTEGVSLSIACKDQAEIDYFWEKLSAVPEAEQCGWCKDKFGVSWQVAPENVEELLRKPNAYANMMQMHKLVIADF